jgi:membrane protease YdiL (CAAX protease family)
MRPVTVLLVAAAIAVTTAMDANGLSEFSALPLLPLALLGWMVERHSRAAMGLVWGAPRHYARAIAHPLVVLGLATAVAFLLGGASPRATDWAKALRDIALMAGATIPVALLTEEGFFRGWLPASLARAGLAATRALAGASIAFALWHVSAVTLDTGFELPAARVPVFLLNAAVLGAIWGALRAALGSIVVASLAHGIWNGGAYVLFGYGPRLGALGIQDGGTFNPESGWLGLTLNAAFLWVVLAGRPRHATLVSRR